MKSHSVSRFSKQSIIVDIESAGDVSEYVVQSHANLELVIVGSPKKSAESDIRVRLVGTGARAMITGIIRGMGACVLTLHTHQIHEAPDTTSDLLIKSVLEDSSQLFYKGGIKVEKSAQKTDAYQRNENLLLSEGTHAESSPALEILANDVRCTHGATIAPISHDELWYVKSRGISEKKAEKLIVKGFIEHAFDRITDREIQNSLWQSL